MEQKDNLLGVLQTLWKWRKPIIYVCGIAIVGTAIITLLMPNYYKANTVFLAASPDQAKPELLFGQGNLTRNEYGNGNDIDRLLTIAESNELVDYLVDSFKLYEHYKINKDNPRARYKVKEHFFKLYKVERTKRDAIELSVEDKDRQLAANIANAARAKIDALGQRLIKEGQGQTIQTFEREVTEKQQQLRTLSDTLLNLRRTYGVYNSSAQTELLTSQQAEAISKLASNRTRLEVLQNTKGVPRDTIIMLNAMVKGLESQVQSLRSQIDTLNQGIAPINTLERQYFDGNANLSQDMERLKIWKAVYGANIPAVKLVEQAEVPIIKSRPKRSVLVIAAGAIAFIFSVFAVLLFDNYQINWRDFSTDGMEENKKSKPKKKAKSRS